MTFDPIKMFEALKDFVNDLRFPSFFAIWSSIFLFVPLAKKYCPWDEKTGVAIFVGACVWFGVLIVSREIASNKEKKKAVAEAEKTRQSEELARATAKQKAHDEAVALHEKRKNSLMRLDVRSKLLIWAIIELGLEREPLSLNFTDVSISILLSAKAFECLNSPDLSVLNARLEEWVVELFRQMPPEFLLEEDRDEATPEEVLRHFAPKRPLSGTR